MAAADLPELEVAQDRVDVEPERALDAVAGRVPVQLLGPVTGAALGDGFPSGLGVDVVPGGEVGQHLAQEPLGLGLLQEVLLALAAGVAPAGSPA